MMGGADGEGGDWRGVPSEFSHTTPHGPGTVLAAEWARPNNSVVGGRRGCVADVKSIHFRFRFPPPPPPACSPQRRVHVHVHACAK